MAELSPVTQKFILHWGEMGAAWGINRSIAQIHALLYLSPEPLTAEEISETLSIARSTVSTSLKELQGWKLVKVSHVLGDRRDHFSTMTDVWQMALVVAEERKRREIDPTIEVIRECVAAIPEPRDERETYLKERLLGMNELLESGATVYEQGKRLPLAVIKRLVRTGGAALRKLGGKGGGSETTGA